MIRLPPRLPLFPYTTLFRSQSGVGDLMRIAVQRGRGAKEGLKMGICGEHGGEPDSVAFCHGLGLDYVSCRSEEHTSELQSLRHLVCRLLLEKKNKISNIQDK